MSLKKLVPKAIPCDSTPLFFGITFVHGWARKGRNATAKRGLDKPDSTSFWIPYARAGRRQGYVNSKLGRWISTDAIRSELTVGHFFAPPCPSPQPPPHSRARRLPIIDSPAFFYRTLT